MILDYPLILGALPLHDSLVALQARVETRLVRLVPPRALARAELSAIAPTHRSDGRAAGARSPLYSPDLCRGGALPRGSRESTVLGPGPGGHVNEDTSVYDHLFFIRPFIPFAFNLIRGVVMHGTLGVLGRGAAPQRLLGAAPRGAATNMEARGNLHQASGDLTSAEVPEVPATATPSPGRGATPGLAVGRRRRHGTMKRLCSWWLC